MACVPKCFIGWTPAVPCLWSQLMMGTPGAICKSAVWTESVQPSEGYFTLV